MPPRPNLSTLFVILVALAMLGVGASQAKTPDGKTPAEESVCDELFGAAFGLCNAYCEAMDCDLRNDGDPSTSPKASATACERVRLRFWKIVDSEVPCECPADAGQLGCPCDGEKLLCDEDAGLVCDEELEICVEDGGGNGS